MFTEISTISVGFTTSENRLGDGRNFEKRPFPLLDEGHFLAKEKVAGSPAPRSLRSGTSLADQPRPDPACRSRVLRGTAGQLLDMRPNVRNPVSGSKDQPH